MRATLAFNGLTENSNHYKFNDNNNSNNNNSNNNNDNNKNKKNELVVLKVTLRLTLPK